MTRVILESLIDLGSECVDIVLDSRGKPFLKLNQDKGIRFNISHSGEYALIAFARHRDLGIDVEAEQPEIDIAELLEHICTPAEAIFMRSLPPSAQTRDFLNLWCRKEAFVKGLGCGLSMPMQDFGLVLSDPVHSRSWRIVSAGVEMDRWRIHDITVDNRHLAALAISGSVSAINVWRLSERSKSRAFGALEFDCENQKN